MKLNLGCGEYPATGWVNIDLRDHDGPTPDVIADLADLPFPDCSAEAVYAGHVFEHVALDDLPAVLAEINRVMALDAVLMVVGPDLDRAEADWPERIRDIVHGAGRWPGDAHLWDSREPLMLRLLVDNGWAANPLPIVEVPSTWPVTSRIGWQFAIEATR